MILSALKKLPFVRNYTTSQWEGWWRDRKIDWKVSYLDTHSHPHRGMISSVLKRFPWLSLLEVGCGPGANLVNILSHFPKRQLGGIDINPEAIKLAKETFNNAFLNVSPVHDIMMSDSSCDVILSDMTLIYYGPRKIHKAIREIKRVARNYVVFSEFHSENPWQRLRLWLDSGLHSHNYRKLLQRHGFHDIILIKMPPEAWPDADVSRNKFRYILLAKVPKRK